mmetsp:Transcript_7089/g.10806  ORF Transcript_7089/g.10806 Transcript_7089/m.10806 type:complete len:150 (-) Transcript_7089:65-514(-)
MVPLVPTGMNIGVGTDLFLGRCKVVALALPDTAFTWNSSAGLFSSGNVAVDLALTVTVDWESQPSSSADFSGGDGGVSDKGRLEYGWNFRHETRSVKSTSLSSGGSSVYCSGGTMNCFAVGTFMGYGGGDDELRFLSLLGNAPVAITVA